jgi:hypothetical protein
LFLHFRAIFMTVLGFRSDLQGPHYVIHSSPYFPFGVVSANSAIKLNLW